MEKEAVERGKTRKRGKREYSKLRRNYEWGLVSCVDILYCPCLSSSVSLVPRLSRAWVAESKSEPNWAKAATSRYWASSSFIEPATYGGTHRERW